MPGQKTSSVFCFEIATYRRSIIKNKNYLSFTLCMLIIVFHVQCCICLWNKDRVYFRNLFGDRSTIHLYCMFLPLCNLHGDILRIKHISSIPSFSQCVNWAETARKMHYQFTPWIKRRAMALAFYTHITLAKILNEFHCFVDFQVLVRRQIAAWIKAISVEKKDVRLIIL